MYYAKLSNAYTVSSPRPIQTGDSFSGSTQGFAPQRPEFEIVGAFASDPLAIDIIRAGSEDGVLSNVVTVITKKHTN